MREKTTAPDPWLNKNQFITSLWLAALVAAASFCGVFIPQTFSREVQYYAAQGIGQDLVNLFLVVPALVIAGYLSRRGSLIAWFVWGGALVYIVYSYILYCFTVRFNFLFLVYCANLGLSFYLGVFTLAAANYTQVKARITDKTPIRMLANYLMFIAVLFALLWLSEIVPALVSGTTPLSITQNRQIVNAVHVLDLSLLLPGLVVAAVFLKKGRPFGYFLAPVMLMFSVFMAIAIGGMMVVMQTKGLLDSLGIAGVFAIITLVSLGVFLRYVRAIKTTP